MTEPTLPIAWVVRRLAGGLIAAAIAWIGWRALWRWIHAGATDAKIDGLIAANRPRLCDPTWQGTDWSKVERAGRARWREVLRAQLRPDAKARERNASTNVRPFQERR